MAPTADPIRFAVEGLERVVAQPAYLRPAEWTAQMDSALAGVKRAVRQRDAELKACGGQLVDVDRPCMPSPTTDRLADQLRFELDGVLDEVALLRSREAHGAPEVEAIRRRAAGLVDVLQHFERQEAEVVQDLLNMDIGCGD